MDVISKTDVDKLFKLGHRTLHFYKMSGLIKQPMRLDKHTYWEKDYIIPRLKEINELKRTPCEACGRVHNLTSINFLNNKRSNK